MKMVSAAGLAGGAFVNGDQIIAATAGENKPVKRPDILVFMVDQLGAKWLEAASRMKLTPHYDRLKDRGTTFTRCITSNPVCTPARSTMITGMTTRQHGVLQNGYPLDPELPNYVRILKAHGYRTAGFGKFHFFPHHIKWDTELSEYGFDLWKQTQDPNKRTFVAKAGIAKRGYFFGFRDETATQTAWISGHALDYLQKPPAGAPLYTFVSYVQPHSPFCPPASCLPRVDPAKLPKPIKRTWPADPLHPVCFDKKPYRGDEAFWMKARHHYFADIAHLDDQLGKLIGVLKKTKRFDNTFIIFTADHGEMLGDHGLSSKANQHYDPVIRIPLTIAGPGLKGSQRRDEFVQLEDIFATVLEMAGGIPLPGYSKNSRKRALPPKLPGFPQSLLPLCRGEKVSGWRRSAYSESFNTQTSGNLNMWARTIRTDRYRYTLCPAQGGEQLFDLKADPDETVNLAGKPAMAKVRQELRDQLLEKIIEQDYPHTVRGNPVMGTP